MKVNKKKLRKSIQAVKDDIEIYHNSFKDVDGSVIPIDVRKHIIALKHAAEILQKLARVKS